MSHHEVPVFLSKIIYMMNACQRLLEDRTPGLLQAANIKLDAVELQAGAPPPRPCLKFATISSTQTKYAFSFLIGVLAGGIVQSRFSAATPRQSPGRAGNAPHK